MATAMSSGAVFLGVEAPIVGRPCEPAHPDDYQLQGVARLYGELGVGSLDLL
jgi:hypothetical protein